jgi:hypothetical protein
MAWGPLETRIDELRIATSRNPAAAVVSITHEIERPRSPHLRPRDRVRLYCLRANAQKKLGLFAKAEKDLLEARGIRRAGPIAAAQIQVIAADVQGTQALATGRGWSEALDQAYAAVLSALEIANAPTGSSDWAIRQGRTRAALLTAALVTRGSIFLYGYGKEAKALRDAMEAIRAAPQWKREINARRNRPLRSALQLVCVCAMSAGNPQDLLIARELAIKFQIPQEDVILRAQQRATVLCIDVKLGKTDPLQAEHILQSDMANLRRLGATTVYNHILDILVWLVGKYQKRPERADWIQENLALNRRQS